VSQRVETREGLLQGVEGEGLRVFRGIPFARPPDWMPYDTYSRIAMELGRRCEPLRLPDAGLLQAWEGIL